ncbi:sensor domain-containing diguanylate cyclase [Novosphingobium sp. Gsoil 351]|uniref:GGDEF domain-containing protein n=1 Tax=Novosphingobium sp. Gsoil 351 TaxID=2675225 RepID=UPI0012B48A8D|nr:sensor domain-containing diguanylate cyclase [Novosphingobium sp. Gsoil 351]QGN56070.1 diguanylate cyclase [Novosphingobium sp. Gsoil 351]
MGVHFTPEERSTLYRLWSDSTDDIILKTDCSGNILSASPGLERVPFAGINGLFGRHILDLVHPSRAAAVMAEHESAVAGRQDGNWVEFPARTTDRQERWFEIQSRCLIDDSGKVNGAVSLMRSIQERRVFEERLFVAAMTDHLTGLTNRSAFVSMLEHLVEARTGGSMAMFDIDHFRAINMRYGHAVGDKLLVAFAELVRTFAGNDDIISRIGGESFGILFPGTSMDHAETICSGIVSALAESSGASGVDCLPITVSAGLTMIGSSLDATIKAGELALTVAKAKGRNRLEVDSGIPAYFFGTAKAS